MNSAMKHRALRYSAGILLFVISCICGALAGYGVGYRAGDRAFNYGATYSKAYSVADLVQPVRDPKSGRATPDFTQLVKTIDGVLRPDQTDATITPYPFNLSVVVTGSGKAHRRIDQVLQELRTVGDLGVSYHRDRRTS